MTIRKNISNVLVGIAIFLLLLVLFKTRDTSNTNPVIVSPITTEKVLPNGQVSQIKVNTPPTKTPIDAGFSKQYLNDTIRKILKVKQKEILALNQIKGTYQDSLHFVRQELDSNKNLIAEYVSFSSARRSMKYSMERAIRSGRKDSNGFYWIYK